MKDSVICDHTHYGAIRALYAPLRADAPHMTRWLELARPAVIDEKMTEDNLRRTEMRSIVLQLERLLTFPSVRERVERGDLRLHGWYYVIEEGPGPRPRSGERGVQAPVVEGSRPADQGAGPGLARPLHVPA